MNKHLILIFLVLISTIFVVAAQESQAKVTEKEALEAISQAELEMKEISLMGSGVFYVNDKIIEARNALQVGGETNYAMVLKKAQEVSNRKERAVRISDSLKALKLRIEGLKGQGMDTAKAEEIRLISLEVFQKENYDEAEELVFRANKNLTDIEAEHTVVRARYNAAKDNTISYLTDNWKSILVVLALLLVAGYITYGKLYLIKTRRKLEDMEIEKKVLAEEMKKTQFDYFNKGNMSRESYEIKIGKYRGMLVKIEERIPVFRIKLGIGKEKITEKKDTINRVAPEGVLNIKLEETVPDVKVEKPIIKVPKPPDKKRIQPLKSTMNRLDMRRDIIESILIKLEKRYKEGAISKTVYNRIKGRYKIELEGYSKEIEKIESELGGQTI